jgi:murein DD-endopeptidase MepM/ murein hydrolase activator NlpD
MRSWTPKSRNYWGQKKRNDSSNSDQEENDSTNDRPPMPWEPQDTTEYDKLYWEGEDSDEIDFDNEIVIPTTEIIENRPKPKKRQSLIEQIKGKPPEDIDPKNFLEKIIRGMIKGKGSDSTPKVIGKNAVMGPEDYKLSPNFKGKVKYFGEGLEFQLPNKLSYQNKVWPSGFIYPVPDSFQLYGSRGFYLDVVGVGSHKGIDLVGKSAGEIKGQPILAIYDGEITEVVKSIDGDPGGVRVQIKSKHRDTGNIFFHYYMHMELGSNDHLEVGLGVKQGTVIGRIGSSNQKTNDQGFNYHLHLQFEEHSPGNRRFDPVRYFYELADLPQQPGSTQIWYK